MAGFDRPALETAISIRTPFNTNLATWFTQLGGPAGMAVLATCAVVALAIRCSFANTIAAHGNWRRWAVGILTCLVLRRLTSHRARATTVLVAIIWSLSMGASRVFPGHHWLTDVMVGRALGLARLAVIITAHRLFLRVRRRAALAHGHPGGHTAYPSDPWRSPRW